MKTGYIIAPIAISAILVLAAFSTPVMAQNACMEDVKTRYVTGFGFTNGTITNGTVIVLEGGSGNGPWTITLPPGEVKMAYAHWHAWGTSNPTVTFTNGNGYTDTIQIIDCEFDDNVSGCYCSGYVPNNGTHHYYWKVNATPGVNTLNIHSGDVYDKWFVAVINNTDAANRTHSGHWWHNFGLWDPDFGVNYSTWFYNASSDPINTGANYTLWTAQSHMNEFSMYFNDRFLDNRSTGSSLGFSLEKFNVDNIDGDGSQKATWKDVVDEGAQYMYVYFATLAEAIPLPDLVVEDFKFPDTAEKGKDFGVNVTIRNQGAGVTGGTFNVSLSVVKEGAPTTYKYKMENVGPLGPDDKTIVNFTVNLPEDGCYNFTAVADCDGDVKESDENNNASSAYFQVGGVIVVHNNNDLMSVANRVVDGTYYIENRTITNCAGCGISIENTTLPVVIQNCTIHDCGYKVPLLKPAGICLRNVTNVTIGGYRNMIVNNTDAGIRVRNSTHVDIMDNYISNNTKYGIYVYPDRLVKPPYPEYIKYINITNNTVLENGEAVTHGDGGIILTQVFNCTVSCNTVQDNDDYGIYVCGNYSCIYNNTIVDNSMYGMKLFNASHNIIFWNDFINNNKINPEYPEHQAYDMWEGQPGLNPHNHWNSTISDFVYKHSGTGSGGSNVSYMGNYWDNDTCTDANNDGICDSPYKIDGAAAANDYYPLKEQWRDYTLMCGDVDCDGKVLVNTDAMKVFRHAIHNEPVCSEWAADVDCDGKVLVNTDAMKVFRHAIHNEPLDCCTGCM